MWSVFFMHMENVDSEPVSFLERPVAEVAGELPVALIHAARVFQVFVSVVHVSKHFTTAITLETLSRVCNEEKQELFSSLQTHLNVLKSYYKNNRTY